MKKKMKNIKLLKNKKRAARRSRRIKRMLFNNYKPNKKSNKETRRVKNMVCYMSKEKITKENVSLEHIIPNALGGKLKSNHLINGEWNDKFGRTIDAELIGQIPLPTLLNVNRDRGKNPKVRAETADGVRYLVDEKIEGKRRPSEPKRTELPNGKIKIEFIEGQEEQILKDLKKKDPKIDIDELRKKIKWEDTPKQKEVFFDNHLTLITGEDAVKAVCKIAANFYVFSSNDTTQIQQIVPFLKGDDKGLGRLKYYYPKNKEIHKLGKDEISHLIHIEGSKGKKLLYAYVELFSCHAFLINLNDDYKGEEIKYTYCYDVNNNKELTKNISLKLTRADIKKMNFPQDANSEAEYFKKLHRIADIKGMKINERKQNEIKKHAANKLQNGK